jgi:Domain of unknown function (DUF222)/HNH endonuclease
VTPRLYDGYMSSRRYIEGDLPDDGTVLDAFVKLLVAEPDEKNRDGLDGLVRRSLRLRGWLDAIDARIAVRAARLAEEGGAADAATVLAGGGRRARRDAQAAAERGTLCEQMPGVGEALADGTVTAGHVDALANAARQLDDDGKARLAEHEQSLVNAAATPEQFDRECQELARNLTGDGGLSRQERMRRDRNVRRWVDKHTGMCKTLLSLDPLTDAQAWTAINAAVAAARSANQQADDRTWDQFQADVVVDLLTGARVAGDERVPEVSVLIDFQTLLDDLHDGSTCETSEGQALPPDTIRRLLCDGDVVPIVLGGDGEVLDVGRQRRLASRAQRRALRAMYRTCAHPSCTVPFDACRIHHVIYWERGGRTDLANMVPLCEQHHHLVHEGGWTLQLFPDRRTTWRTSDGTVSFDGITTDRVSAPTIASGGRRTGYRAETKRCRVETAARVAAELEYVLAEVSSRAPP